MNVEQVPIDNIDIPPRLRAVDTSKVARLAESMDAIGLQTPITLYHAGDDQEGFDLVTGAHRLEAARSLGWEWIDAFFMEADEIDRQLWEIDENLMRSELTPVQMAEHLAKRKELWEARQESGASCATLTGRGNKQFAKQTSDATGVAKSTINRAVSRADGVTEEARDVIRGTRLDTGVFLDRLKGIDESEQADFAQRHLDRFEGSKPKLAPDPDNDLIVKERQVSALISAWNKAGKDAREEFLSRIETSIMDQRGWN